MVSLRKFNIYDVDRMIELANNPKIAENLRDAFPHPYLRENATKFLKDALDEKYSILRAIEWNGEYVGNIGLHFNEDVYRYNSEIGYFIGETYWGNGIATKAIPLMLEIGFQHPRIHRVFAGVFSYNPASMRVLEKVGFRSEGIAAESISKHGKIYDEHRYAILKREFQSK